MTAAQASRAKVIAAYAAIYIIWGSTYLAIKYGIETFPPFALGAVRFLFAGIILFAWARWRSDVKLQRVHWLHAFFIGMLMLGVGNGAVVWSEQRIPSGIAALIVAIIPLMVVVIEWVRPGGRRPRALVLVGVLVGLGGLALLVGPSFGSGGAIDLTGVGVLLIGSLAWSIATVFGKQAKVPGYPPITSAMQLLSGGVCLTVLSLSAGEGPKLIAMDVTTKGVLSVLYLAIFGSIVAFSAFSWLMRTANSARISTYAYVNPVVAMLLGWLFANEEMTVRTLIAAGVVLAGVVLITRGEH
ncbi:MAG TPA: EamA family transporter [Longimicrobiales bacterium]|nr:EamA family transporter [Longimicrobiales bacterium]